MPVVGDRGAAFRSANRGGPAGGAGARRLETWLASRDSGLVPIADARSFQWAGWWIAVVDGSDSALADGPQRQVAVLAFGTPPGVVLSPQDPALLGCATADLDISSAYAVASLDPVLPVVPEGPPLSGVVERLAVAPQAEVPMQVVARVRALAATVWRGTATPSAPARSVPAAHTGRAMS